MTRALRLLPAIAPWLMLGIALWRRLSRRETPRDLAERLGHHGPAGALWLHGASNGELASARWVIEALAQDAPVLVTASTPTGREMVRAWALPGVSVSLAPLDLAGPLSRFLMTSPPRGFINLEGEFWPRRFAALQARGVPVALIGARMSERSARFWAAAGAGFLRGVTLASAQDAASGARLAALGLPAAAWRAPCDLKAEAVRRQGPAARIDRAARAGVLLAASTHEGEDEVLLCAFASAALAGGPRLLILAPRHPRRGPDLARRITAQGLALAQRSKGEALPDPGAPGPRVYLADTLGEMDLWYAAAGLCLVGGSLVDKGGHTPWEPARHGAAILHGPHVANFAAAYAALDAAGGALQVQGPADLTAALLRLDAGQQQAMAQAADALQAGEASGAGGVFGQTGSGAALLAALRQQFRVN